MAAGGKPLRLAVARDRTAIYSVGDDGVDDGGSEVIPIPTGNAARIVDDNPWPDATSSSDSIAAITGPCS